MWWPNVVATIYCCGATLDYTILFWSVAGPPPQVEQHAVVRVCGKAGFKQVLLQQLNILSSAQNVTNHRPTIASFIYRLCRSGAR